MQHCNVKLLTWLCLFFSAIAPINPAYAAEVKVLNIYSHRQPFLLKPLIETFSDKHKIKVNIVYADGGGLVQRMLSEGKNSPADVILTSDIADLILYADNDLLAPLSSSIIASRIPSELRDQDERWFAVSRRARILAVSKQRVKEGEIRDLEDLAKPQWKGRVCTRQGSHVYNRALMAGMLAAHGSKKAEAWGRGLVANLARKPQGNDRAQAKAIYQGICDVAVMNSYYYGKMKYSDDTQQQKWASSIRLLFTNQAGRGNHINISGAGMSRYAKHKAHALTFLEFLTTPQAQQIYSEQNFEYPANPNVAASAEVASWGDFKADSLPITRIADLSRQAQKIINRIGW